MPTVTTADVQQGAPSPRPPSTTTQRSTRLRLACDTCSAAKIKCDKKRPICDRCTSNKLACSYSPSRRCGKQSWAKKFAHEQAPLKPATTDSLLRSAGDPCGLELPPGAGMQAACQDRHVDAVDSDDPFFKWLDPIDGHGNVLDVPQRWPEADILMDFPIADYQASSLQALTPFPLLNEYSQTLEQRQSDAVWPGAVLEALSEPNQTSLTAEPAKKTSSAGFGLEKTHDCERWAYATLDSLYCPAMLHFDSQNDETLESLNLIVSDASSSAPLGASTPMRPSLDKVLYTNKAALGTLVELLDCPCAHHPHLALLYTSIVSKVLFRYRVAACVQSLAPLGAPSKPIAGSSAQDLSAATPSPALSRSAGVLPTLIQVGIFDLDEEDQITLQHGLLLRETQKVEKVVEKMASLNDACSLDYGCEEGSAMNWYALASGRLRAELQKTVEKVREVGIAHNGGEG